MIKALRRSEKENFHLHSFRTEAEFVARLHHANILSLLDTGESGDWVYHVYELAEMKSLRSRLQEGAVDISLALGIAQQLADMLAYLHEQGLVHGFCHPSNILLGASHQVKVMGFNYGKFFVPSYSPEQFSGTGITPQSDIYTLGCVIWEMITGQPYIRINNTGELPQFHMNPPKPDIAAFCADVPRWLQRLLSRCLASKPSNRPQSIDDIRAELEGRAPPRGLEILIGPLKPILTRKWTEPIQTIIGDLSQIRSPALGFLRMIDLCEVLIKLPAILALDLLPTEDHELPSRPSHSRFSRS
jgi:serine/threonine protein kinase